MRSVMRLLPCFAYLGLSLLLGRWIVDDSGISYAYARNLAQGYGFVSQPGVPPVEGFSNFIWVLALTPLMLLRAFDPMVVPKVLSAVLVLAALLILQRSMKRVTGSAWPGWFAAFAIAISPPIVIWTMSGLENGLTLLLAAAYGIQLVEQPPRWAIKAGALAALLAMSHPELILLFATGFVVSVVTRNARTIASFVAAFAIPTGLFFAFRLVMFGLPLPHTYYAKRTTMSTFDRLLQLAQSPLALWDRTIALAQGLGGFAAVAVAAFLVVAAAALLLRRRIDRATAVWLLLALNAAGTYLWMEDDWMGEFRFATVVVLATFAAAALAGDALLRTIRVPRVAGAVAAAAVIALMIANAVPRITAFASNPTTPYDDVARRTAHQFDAYARHVTTERPSLLVADIGATLFEGNLRVYDLAGLCEPDVVRTLKNNTQYWLFEHPQFYDWVFDTIKPTFISSEKFWTYVANFEKDPRFRRDYVAINAFPDVYLQNVFKVSMRSGDFVRRDALARIADVDAMRQSYQPPPRPDMQVAADAQPDRVAAAARTLDGVGRPHDARPLWATAAQMAPPGSPLQFEAIDRLGDQRAIGSAGDALDADMAAGVRLLYTDRQPEAALAVFDEVLLANPSHYGALFQRARALTMLSRIDQARAAWLIVAARASQINDRATAATALAELQKITPT